MLIASNRCSFVNISMSDVIEYDRADLTVIKRPGSSYQIEIHFAVVNHLNIFCSPL